MAPDPDPRSQPQPPPGVDEDLPGALAPRYVPPMRRMPRPRGEPTPGQARFIARAGLVLTLVLAAVGLTGVVWAVLAALGVVR